MIFFKAEANPNIGGGHLHRCIAIATECQKQGQEVAFIFAETVESSTTQIKDLGFPTFFIDIKKQFELNTYTSIIPSGSLILFDTDDYHFYSGKLIDNLQSFGIKTACFTITDKHPISTDVLINTNIISKTHSYKTPIETIKLLGPRYLIFNSKFQKLEITPKEETNYQNLFLFFGNADANGLTHYILDIITQLKFQFKKVIVVVGALNPNKLEIEKSIAENSTLNIEYRYNTPNLVALYEETDIAITAAGMTMWEMALFKIPQLVIASSERELTYTSYLENVNFIHFLGSYNQIFSDENLASRIDSILKSKKLEKLDLDSFKNTINPNGITDMVKAFVSLVQN